MSTTTPAPHSPSLPWRLTSSFVMGLAGSLSRGFYFGLNNMEVIGLDRFLQTLDARKDVEGRERGLITVSNHVCVIDDPLVWGVLPMSYSFNPDNHRWSLGSYDICFKNKFMSSFFTFGQVLPTHRNAYSPEHGGLFQPTITQAIRLLSSQPFAERQLPVNSRPVSISPSSPDIIDPFSTGELTYSTNGVDVFPAPSAYSSRKHSWVHIFPEGRVHQHPQKTLRYFKWGVSRLILESEPLPEIVPMFIDGHQEVMAADRTWPRFVPRAGKNIKVVFGESVDGEKVFGDLRKRWQSLVKLQQEALVKKGLDSDMVLGELTDGLKYSKEVAELRKEVTKRVRMEVLKVRKSLGYSDEDPKEGLAETWIVEGGKQTGKMNDGSWVGET
ncbi:hypothetical protein BP5796_09991 [Coleophoma crateriformis]|uniref:Tafazzin family protein n=1 Tax=Coleophoma crateriformis TaxID=565419 RepID=A0A3D8QU30_9HELO|nr:hypothetical protein BP5796_09991 [Coleophoma crateriformis]